MKNFFITRHFSIDNFFYPHTMHSSVLSRRPSERRWLPWQRRKKQHQRRSPQL